MESQAIVPLRDLAQCCSCGCTCSSLGTSSETWLRSVKRKYDEYEDGNRLFVPGLEITSVARVQAENEIIALREMVTNQQQVIEELSTELDEERNASSSAANEAMSMILRLQREKAEIQMEARQFKRFAEEKMGHDQQEMTALEELLYKREQGIQSLTCEVQAYKHRMMSYGLTEAEADGEKSRGYSRSQSMLENFDGQSEYPPYDYPPLRCNLNENYGPLEGENDSTDIEKYPFGETPRGPENLRDLEYRIRRMERSTSNDQLDGDLPDAKNTAEKVMVGQSPRRPRHLRRFSNDSSSSFLGMGRDNGNELAKDSPRPNISIKRMEYISRKDDYSNLRTLDQTSEPGDDMSDRIYTIDSVHNGTTEPKPVVGICDDYMTTPRESMNRTDFGDPDIMKLYMRLQALEADRESMRQAIISMRTDKAQLVLLKEIAQHLCKEMSPERRMPVVKPSVLGSFSFMSIFKWIASFVFWRRKARRSKYMFGLSASNIGLLLALDKSPQIRQGRCLTSTQV